MESLEVVFVKLLNAWRAAEGPTSLANTRAEHWAYRQIIKLGWPVVPLILKELETHHGEPWSLALQEITGEDPIPESDYGRVSRMAEAWLNWGRQKGIF